MEKNYVESADGIVEYADSASNVPPDKMDAQGQLCVGTHTWLRFNHGEWLRAGHKYRTILRVKRYLEENSGDLRRAFQEIIE